MKRKSRDGCSNTTTYSKKCWHPKQCRHVCIDPCIDMCTDMCVDICIDICADMCTDMCVHMGTSAIIPGWDRNCMPLHVPMHMSLHISLHMCAHCEVCPELFMLGKH